MNVEDSYEGAVRRLRRLEHAGVDLAPRQSELEVLRTRMRGLEDLATLACDDNERLERELADARQQVQRLQRLVETLQETIANPEQPADLADSFSARKSGGGGLLAFMIVLAALGGTALYVLRPWEHMRSAAASVASAPVEPVAPVVVPPPPVVPPVVAPTPVVAPRVVTTPVVAAPSIPKVSVPVVAPSRASSRHHKPAKHSAHSGRKHRDPAAVSGKVDQGTGDPLGGLDNM